MIVQALQSYRKNARAFEEEAHSILAVLEAAPSRVILLDKMRARLAILSLQQDGLFREALKCIEIGVYRAGHVMGWAAFMDCLERKLASDGLVAVMSRRPQWAKYTSIEELREYINEYDIITVAREVRLLSKGEMKTLHGMLSTRNQCAHPSDYNPGLNEAVGYVSQLLTHVERLQCKSL